MPKQTDREYVLSMFARATCELMERRGEKSVYGVFVSAHAGRPLATGKTPDEAWEMAASHLRVNLESSKQRLLDKSYGTSDGGRKL
jgi:hypothetical protein